MVLSSQFLSPQVLQKIEAELISRAPVDYIVTKTGVGKSSIYRFRANLKAYGSIRCPIRVRKGFSSMIDNEAIKVRYSTMLLIYLTYIRALSTT